MSRKKNLLLSVTISLFLHLISAHLATRYSLWFSSDSSLKQVGEISKIDRDQILKETFSQEGVTLSRTSSTPKQEDQQLSLKPVRMKEPHFHLFQTPAMPSFPTNENLLIATHQTVRFTLPSSETFNLFEHLPKDLILPLPQSPTIATINPIQMTESILTVKNSSILSLDEPPSTSISYTPRLFSASSLKNISSPPKAVLSTPPPELPSFPSLAQLETVSYSDSFDTDLVFLPREDGEGYIFALTLIPKSNLNLPKINQNYSFLIDRSNSVQKERLLAAKNAVYKALNELDSDDTFNIITFDSKIDKLSPIPLNCSDESLKAAKTFLDGIELGSFFSNANLFKPLFLTLPYEVKDEELHTVIVLTDGELLNKRAAQKSLLYEWTHHNSARVSLFGLGIGSDPHLSCLEAATAFNRGAMVYCPTKGSIKRKLLKLMKTVSYPIAKNLSYKAISVHNPSHVTLYPKQMQTPHLYLNEPYVIMGTTESLDDFILFIQGRLKNKWIHIKKKVSFDHAKKGGASLKAGWAMQRVYGLYEQYLHDENLAHISEAESLLAPYNLKPAFQ